MQREGISYKTFPSRFGEYVHVLVAVNKIYYLHYEELLWFSCYVIDISFIFAPDRTQEETEVIETIDDLQSCLPLFTLSLKNYSILDSRYHGELITINRCMRCICWGVFVKHVDKSSIMSWIVFYSSFSITFSCKLMR